MEININTNGVLEVRRESQKRFFGRTENDVHGSQITALEKKKYLNSKKIGIQQIKLINRYQ